MPPALLVYLLLQRNRIHNIDFHHGPNIASYITLPAATAITSELIKSAVKLVDRLFEDGASYKKAGVMLSGLCARYISAGKYVFARNQKWCRMLMGMIDNVNFSMRDDMIKYAASGTTRNWKMRQAHHSPRYTSRWDELFEVS